MIVWVVVLRLGGRQALSESVGSSAWLWEADRRSVRVQLLVLAKPAA